MGEVVLSGRTKLGEILIFNQEGNATKISRHRDGVSIVVNMETLSFLRAYKKWAQGALIQNAFPTLSASEREFLMTGMTDDEWNNLFEER